MTAINKKDILNKEYDFKRLTKPQLREVMSMLNVENIPSLYVKKDELLSAYKEQVYDRLDDIDEETFTFKKKNFSKQNTFQQNKSTSEKITEKKKSVESLPNKNTQNGKEKKATERKPDVKNTIKKSVPEKFVYSEADKNVKNVGEKLKALKSAKRLCCLAKIIKILFMTSFLSLIIWLKFFIPYCSEENKRYCIPLPKNGHLIDSKLFCDRGFRKISSIIDYCVYDTRIEYNNRMKAAKIIKNLEYLKGEYKYGFKETAKIKAREIEADEVVLNILKESDLLLFQGAYVESLNTRVSIKLLIRFYIMKCIKGFLGIAFIVVFFKIVYYGRAQRNKNKAEAQANLPRILVGLNKQAVIAAKTTTISSLVYSNQLQDAFEIKDEVWVYIESMLKENSNIAFEYDENEQLRFKWVGILFSRSSSNVQLAENN
ncbi:hypothetical protein EHP00_1653 [Ecytonucleospora hepatopenaei]|uniref:Man1/Src1 C-terminal domain-containing protein n=1 Tax=Ecytonucleospora hepatopenaei TaxID=646526 RepID=A0A1W0E802_9MICR|nr:hypothetical protein EHP00_1653 [Ecytonucleospora hepatopenaei]